MDQKDMLKKYLHEDFTETELPNDFTASVMSKIELLEKPEFIYEPLISKRAWLIIIISFCVLPLLVMILSVVSQVDVKSWFEYLNFNLDFLQPFEMDIQLFFKIILVFASLTLADLLFKKSKINLSN